MRCFLGIVLLVAGLIADSASAQEAEMLRGPHAVFDRFAPRSAVSRVVTMEREVGSGPPLRGTITRRGDWIRQDWGRRITFSNMRSGASFELQRAENGRYTSLSVPHFPRMSTDVWPAIGVSPYAVPLQMLVSRRRTGERDAVLGEACEVWEYSWGYERDRFRDTELHCLTSDGILLWSRQDTITERAVSVERRESAPEHVRPPNEVFDWSY